MRRPIPSAVGVDYRTRRNRQLLYMDEQKQLYAKACAPWTEDDNVRLKQLYAEGKSIEELVKIFERNEGAIRSRLRK